MTLPERFWSKVEFGDACWTWQAKIHRSGYGHFWLMGGMKYAHRVAYELLVGPIPEGRELDHLCRNRACVNPDHLDPVLHRTNLLRGVSPSAINANKAHCPRGHDYDTINTYLDPQGRRQCRSCRAARRRAAVAA